jgi:hypothetical protein
MLQGLTLLPLFLALVGQLWRTAGPGSLALLLVRMQGPAQIDQA